MIISVTANKDTFKSVAFQPGLNLILAERAEGSTDQDSRNAVGKTTLLQIVHHCLGANLSDHLRKPMLREEAWEFTLDVMTPSGPISITRGIVNDRVARVSGVTLPRYLEPEPVGDGVQQISIQALNAWLGQQWFGLPVNKPSKYCPTFRNLISYFARREFEVAPYQFMSGQRAWDRDVHNAYLLGLDWQPFTDLKLLDDRKAVLRTVKKSIKDGVLRGPQGDPAAMESRRVRLDQEIGELERQLHDFKVHPDYREIEEQATALTAELRKKRNNGFRLRTTLRHYEESLGSEIAPAEGSVVGLFQAAQVELPDEIRHTIEQVEAFHQHVIHNRIEFLREECLSLQAQIAENEAEEARIGEDRAKALSIIDSFRALDEYNQLHERLSDLRHERDKLVESLRQRREIDNTDDEIATERRQVISHGRRVHDEREAVRARAIEFFNSNSRALYGEGSHGALEIAFTTRGSFSFHVDIQGEGSQGIEKMKLFCFDLMLAQLWANRDTAPGFVFHDSHIFDGVDDRQKAAALRLAAQQAEEHSFQYICSFNSNDLPSQDLLGELDLTTHTRLTLTDEGPLGKLLGCDF
ncbi:MAG: DUF2326 domain-containing protein [Thermodesulfobacteriota bacterium]